MEQLFLKQKENIKIKSKIKVIKEKIMINKINKITMKKIQAMKNSIYKASKFNKIN